DIGTPLSIAPDTKSDIFTLIGFSHGTSLVADSEQFSNNSPFGSGVWIGNFSTDKGTSGGPLLNSHNQIVGIQSGVNNNFLGQGPLDQADRITTGQLSDINNWEINDHSLLHGSSAQLIQAMASSGVSQTGPVSISPTDTSDLQTTSLFAGSTKNQG